MRQFSLSYKRGAMKNVFFATVFTVSVVYSSGANAQVPLVRTQADEVAYDIAFDSVYYNANDMANHYAHPPRNAAIARNYYEPLVPRPRSSVLPIETRFNYWWSKLNPNELNTLDYELHRKYSPAAAQRIIDETYRNRVTGLIAAIESGSPVCSAYPLKIGFSKGNYDFPLVPNRYSTSQIYGPESVTNTMFSGSPLRTSVPARLISDSEYSNIEKMLSQRDRDNNLLNGVKTCWKPLGFIRTEEGNGGGPGIPRPVMADNYARGELVGNIEIINFKTGKTVYVLPKTWFN